MLNVEDADVKVLMCHNVLFCLYKMKPIVLMFLHFMYEM